MPIYVPKQIVPLTPTTESPLLFLAGPIRGGGDWQTQMAEEVLKQEPSALVACPCRWDANHQLANYFDKPFSDADNRQLVWEIQYLEQAGLELNVPGCVIFWLGQESVQSPHPGPESYAMDTRREIGMFTAYADLMGPKVRVVVGGHPDFYGLDVILFWFRKVCGSEFQFHLTMPEIVADALQTARK